VIGANGRVGNVEVKSSPDPALSAAAAEAVSR
jgi:outer membrane biosynthesis protein TonB